MSKAVFQLLFLLIMFISPWLACAQSGGSVTIDLVSPRPLEAFVLELTRRFPVFVTYEDPQYEYRGDLRDATIEVWNPLVPNNGKRIFFPVELDIALTFSIDPTNDNLPNVDDVLRNLATLHHQRGIGGRFRIEQVGDVFHVIPTMRRNEEGAWITQPSVLDAMVTIAPQDVDGLGALELFVDALADAGDSKVHLGVVPVGLLKRSRHVFGARNQRARDVLTELVGSLYVPFTWTLEYEPNERAHILGLHLVAPDLHPISPPTRPTNAPGGPGSVDFRSSPFLTPERKRQLEEDLSRQEGEDSPNQ